ncbi:hypothetical protein SAY87_015946 [Trapa incisa]|uniref:Uncharacterized protein n=1 Tax=Trapa incisa TaxID=236973 RepID=A0AAN7QXM0_9MYRT|nr:hypothetical protein SAY87_015946 [Trapa incisa]
MRVNSSGRIRKVTSTIFHFFERKAPCYILWMVTIRRISLNNYPGFDYGGMFWFQNLTEYPQAWTLANLSAGQFMMGVEDNVSTWILPEFDISSTAVGTNWVVSGGAGRSGSAAGALDSSAGAQASIKLEHA